MLIGCVFEWFFPFLWICKSKQYLEKDVFYTICWGCCAGPLGNRVFSLYTNNQHLGCFIAKGKSWTCATDEKNEADYGETEWVWFQQGIYFKRDLNRLFPKIQLPGNRFRVQLAIIDSQLNVLIRNYVLNTKSFSVELVFWNQQI